MSGVTGMLGRAISSALKREGWEVLKLARRPAQAEDEINWNPSAGSKAFAADDLPRLSGIDAVIHLSGANVAKGRWTRSYKQEIVSSRVGTTAALAVMLRDLADPPEVFVSASAIGIYGDRGDEILDEDSVAGHGFFPELCQAWERASLPAAEAGIRIVHPRFGVVLGAEGGALRQMKPLFKMGLGGKLGSGRQWMSWVSEADVVAAVLFAIHQTRVTGAINVVSPTPVTNADFTRALAGALHRPGFMTAPSFALRLAFGEMADEALLASSRAIPKRLSESGFQFSYPTLQRALDDIFPR